MSDHFPKEERISIPDWSVDDRPREKFASKGASTLSNAELIAILLRSGSAIESAVDLSKRLLCQCNLQLHTLAEMTLEQLIAIKGIGPAKAITLLAAFELGRRLRVETVSERVRIRTSSDAFQAIQGKIAHLKHEEFWAIYLSQASQILHLEQIGKGGLTSTVADVRVILQVALAQKATALILCHNHPSGSLNPSPEDISLTNQIKKASNILNIRLLDHIIVHNEKYFSFQEHGYL